MKKPILISSLVIVALTIYSQQSDFSTIQGPYIGQTTPDTNPVKFAPGIISTDAHEFSCCFSPDGTEFYFTRRSPETRQPVVMVCKQAEGTWTKPEPLAALLPLGFTFEPFVTPDNTRLYFQTSAVVNGKPEMLTRYLERTKEGWSDMKDPGEAFNPGKTMHISATMDGTIYTTDISGGMGSESLGMIRMVNDQYEKLEKLKAPFNKTEKQQHPWIAPDEGYIIFTVRRPGQTPVSVLFCAFRNKDGDWSDPVELKLGMDAGQPCVSPDGKYLFFTSGDPKVGSDIYRVSAKMLEVPKIFEAIKSNDVQEVQRLVTANHSLVDSLNDRGNTPLIVAIAQNNDDMIKLLIDEGSNVNYKNRSGYTPLHYAADRNMTNAVLMLLEKGAEINSVSNYQITPLFSAIEKKNIEVTTVLIEHGADVNFSSPVIGCPIHRVIYADSPDLLNLLISKGADIEAKDAQGKTALHLSGMLGRIELTSILTDNGADVNSKDPDGLTPLHLAVLWGQDKDGKNQSAELAKIFVGKGAAVNTMTDKGEIPLSSAAENGYTDIVTLLHTNGGDIHWRSKENSRTLLHIVCIKGYGDLADYLVAQGLDKNSLDSEGKTACDYALKFGHDKIALSLSGDNKLLERSENASKYLLSGKAENKAHIWKMNNRGWAVFADNRLFIFDNEENGRMPDQPSLSNGWVLVKEISDQNIIAMYSCYHATQGSMEFIHAKEDSLKNIVYLNYVDDKWRGGRNTRYISGREIQKIDDLEMIPYETHDDYGMGSLGYLIKTGAVTFFYPNFFPEDIELFKKEIDYLSEHTSSCDFAIVYIDNEINYAYTDYLIGKLKPGMIIPYNVNRATGVYKTYKEELLKKYPGITVNSCNDPGERIDYSR